ncbi:MAG: WecB/TagA/CpsF family glycosyltransferase [Desulfamplus sp.]|nr:WecB/TagA/CpsF family glycosyltransferase [Desulfamplus sp.]
MEKLILMCNSGKIIIFINPFSYLILRKKIPIVKNVDKICIDGFLIIFFLNMLSFTNKFKRCSFDMTSIAPSVFRNAYTENKTIYIIGTTQDNLKNCICNIKETQNINLIGFRDGYFDTEDEKNEALTKIKSINPDIVICGMGSPLQEEFLVKLKTIGWFGESYTCGGFLHQTAKRINYYPEWVDKLNMRWAYRIYDEPKLFFRYFKYYPYALLLFFMDYIKYKILNKKNFIYYIFNRQ